MNRSIFLLVCASVLLSAVAQIVLKTGMSSAGMAAANSQGPGAAMFRAIATNPYVLVGLFIYFASAAVWLLVLAKLDVSLAYPFVAMGFVVTMLLAWALRGEVPTPTKIAGTLLICLGVIVMARA